MYSINLKLKRTKLKYRLQNYVTIYNLGLLKVGKYNY